MGNSKFSFLGKDSYYRLEIIWIGATFICSDSKHLFSQLALLMIKFSWSATSPMLKKYAGQITWTEHCLAPAHLAFECWIVALGKCQGKLKIYGGQITRPSGMARTNKRDEALPGACTFAI